MTDCVSALRRVLGDTFVMYVHSHIAHWNVTGPNFWQYHKLLDDLQAELWGALDPIAEHIRTCDDKVGGTLQELIAPSAMVDQDFGSDWTAIRAGLMNENDIVIAGLKEANAVATQSGMDGVANFLQERLDIHAKHGWFLRASA